MRPAYIPEPVSKRWEYTPSPAPASPCLASPDQPCFRPGNIRDWVDIGTLISWLDEEIAHLALDQAASNPSLSEPGIDPAKPMLGLLAYAYATETLDSAEISRNCESLTAFRLLSDGRVPTPAEIASFRRQHRDLIVTLLVTLFLRAFSRSSRGSRKPVPLALASQLGSCLAGRIDIARHLDTEDD
jgi:hypothetical protein